MRGEGDGECYTHVGTTESKGPYTLAISLSHLSPLHSLALCVLAVIGWPGLVNDIFHERRQRKAQPIRAKKRRESQGRQRQDKGQRSTEAQSERRERAVNLIDWSLLLHFTLLYSKNYITKERSDGLRNDGGVTTPTPFGPSFLSHSISYQGRNGRHQPPHIKERL